MTAPRRLVDTPEHRRLMQALKDEPVDGQKLAQNRAAIKRRLGERDAPRGVRALISAPVTVVLIVLASVGLAMGVTYAVKQLSESPPRTGEREVRDTPERRSENGIESEVEPIHETEAIVERRGGMPTIVEPEGEAPTKPKPAIGKPSLGHKPVPTDAQQTSPSIALAEQLELFERAEALAREDELETALAQLDTLEQRYPKSALAPEIALLRLGLLVRNAQIEDAIRLGNLLLEEDKVAPRHQGQVYHLIADCWLKLENCDKATLAYRKALEVGVSPFREHQIQTGLRRCEKE